MTSQATLDRKLLAMKIPSLFPHTRNWEETNGSNERYVAARLDVNGVILELCEHDYNRSYIKAIVCARKQGWNGFAKLHAAYRHDEPCDVWRFYDQSGGSTRLKRLDVISAFDLAL